MTMSNAATSVDAFVDWACDHTELFDSASDLDTFARGVFVGIGDGDVWSAYLDRRVEVYNAVGVAVPQQVADDQLIAQLDIPADIETAQAFDAFLEAAAVPSRLHSELAFEHLSGEALDTYLGWDNSGSGSGGKSSRHA